MNQRTPDSRPRVTAKQGQYLAFIHAYRRLLGQSPAEADMQRFFQVTSPSVHQMVLSLEKAGLITRQPGIARSITLAIEFRGQVKHHAEASRGRVKNLLAGEDYGFIETADGREIFFHRNAVLDAAFDRKLRLPVNVRVAAAG